MALARRLCVGACALSLILPAAVLEPLASGWSLTHIGVREETVRQVELSLDASGTVTRRLTHLASFSLVGVTWEAPGAQRTAPVTLSVRVHAHGQWTSWQRPELGDTLPDPRHLSVAGRRGTEPLWTGPADGVEVNAKRVGQTSPRDLRLELVDPGSRPEDSSEAASSSAAWADTGTPVVVPRARWGAKERWAWWKPEFADSVQGVVIHHTDTPNGYSRSQAVAQVRAIFAYHARSLGWGDIGYHYVVDRFGTIYEGRKGGIGSTVVGGHTYGFNHGSVGIALLGTYSRVKPAAAQMESVARLTAWVLASAHRDPTGTATYTVDENTNPRYRKGRVVTTRAIVGHGNLYPTSCPGSRAWRLLPWLRNRVDRLIGPQLDNPTITAVGSLLTITVSMRRATAWSASATGPGGSEVGTWSGSGPMVVPWSLAGLPPGAYGLTATAGDGLGAVSTPLLVGVQIGPSQPALTTLPTGVLARLSDHSLWQVADAVTSPGQLRRPMADWVAATYPRSQERAVRGMDGALTALGVGPAVLPREGALLHDTGGDRIFVVSDGKARSLDAVVAVQQGYDTSTAQDVTPAQLATLPVGDPMSVSGPHPIGSWIRDSGGAFWVVVGAADGTLLRRRVVTQTAMDSQVPAADVLAASTADTALSVDTWERGIADGVLWRGHDGSVGVISRGLTRDVPPDLLAALGVIPIDASLADLGRAAGQAPVGGAPVSPSTALASATVNIFGQLRPSVTATWPILFYTGADVAPPTTDPARP